MHYSVVATALPTSSLYSVENIGGHLVSNIRLICKHYSDLGHTMFHKDMDNLCRHHLRSLNSFSQVRVAVRYYDCVLVSALILWEETQYIDSEKIERVRWRR